ncbi:MAG: T9SS type A sorting domain-containing protein [Bacteroidia bacterium]|nr:T9SS type A sorting domain-containing protein [Bacteroidia bacterium]
MGAPSPTPRLRLLLRQRHQLRQLLITTTLSLVAVAAFILIHDVSQVTGIPSLVVRFVPETARPGDKVRLTYELDARSIDADDALSLEVKLGGQTGATFVAESFALQEGTLTAASVYPYANEASLVLTPIPTGQMLSFSVEIQLPNTLDLHKRKLIAQSVAYVNGRSYSEDVSRSLSQIKIEVPLFTLDKRIVSGIFGPGSRLAYQVVVSNPEDGGDYTSDQGLLAFMDILSHPDAAVDVASIEIQGIQTGTPVVSKNTLVIDEINLAPGQTGIISYEVQLPGEPGDPDVFTNTAQLYLSGTALKARATTTGQTGSFPVTWTGFEVQVSGKRATLRWETAQEQQNKGFEIEQRQEGQAFTPIGFVPGAGTVNTPRQYTFQTGELTPGRYLYRLRQMDLDGNHAYSKWVEAVVGAPGGLSWSISPLPVQQGSTLSISAAQTQPVSIEVLDLQGRTIRTLFTGQINAQVPFSLALPVGDLAGGVYLIQVRGAQHQETRKVLIR